MTATTIQAFTREALQLPSGLRLEASLSVPQEGQNNERKLAICLHPWSRLGGSMDDPSLYGLKTILLAEGYHVLRYNSRGVGKSSGWASFTGIQEGKDLEELVQWCLNTIPNVKTLLLLGYSHGSLVTSLFPISAIPDVKIYHILLSYPLGPRSFLTAFRGGHYTTALNNLLHDPRSNVLVVYGDQDEFTGEDSYDTWARSLKAAVQVEGRGKLEINKIHGATHFWMGQNDATAGMLSVVKDWAS